VFSGRNAFDTGWVGVLVVAAGVALVASSAGAKF
jgi:hypothetical protein